MVCGMTVSLGIKRGVMRAEYCLQNRRPVLGWVVVKRHNSSSALNQAGQVHTVWSVVGAYVVSEVGLGCVKNYCQGLGLSLSVGEAIKVF